MPAAYPNCVLPTAGTPPVPISNLAFGCLLHMLLCSYPECLLSSCYHKLTEFSDLARGNSSTQHAIKVTTECDDFPGSQLLFIQMLCRSCTYSQQISQKS